MRARLKNLLRVDEELSVKKAVFCFLVFAGGFSSAHAGQWYTGSLVSPSGTTREGVLNVEPYFSYSQPLGSFGPHGRTLPASHPLQRMFSNSTLWKYGISQDFSIQIHTIVDYGWKHANGHSHGPKTGDVPVDLIYRLVRPDPRRYIPALNLFAGMIFPTGDYKKLHNIQDGVGSGAYVFRFALTAQSTYTLPGHHELRVRAWNWFRRAVTSASLTDETSYGTAYGFRGRGRPGMSGQSGFSLEYGLTQKWVLVMDLARDWSNGSVLRGHDTNGTYVSKTGSANTDWQIAPAFEYNWNANWGIIAGAAFYFSGHNKNIQVSPQFAINSMF
ncbi:MULTISPECIES: transporter [unclassified Gluconobacter]|uniref:transporter n=1 Tax=unclassified Gluconobacter TaxID=2644261 RepID=UPI00207B1824|nr:MULTISPECIES: transporter [unclassified Gluconobacter]